MYKDRRQQFKKQALRTNELREEAASQSRAGQINNNESTTGIYPMTIDDSQLSRVYTNSQRQRELSLALHESTASQIKRPKAMPKPYQFHGESLMYLKKIKHSWEPLSGEVRKQLQEIISTNYRKTLRNIAGSSETTTGSAEKMIKPVGQEYYSRLRSYYYPADISTQLLKANIDESTDDFREQNQRSLRDLAIIIQEIIQSEEDIKNDIEELKELKERRKEAEILRDTYSGFKEHVDPDDYVQNWLRFPSSMETE